VIGPYDFKRPEGSEMILAWMKKASSFSIESKFDFVDVSDIARGHILAAECGICGDIFYHLSHQKPIFTHFSVETLYCKSHISSRKAYQELEYQCRLIAKMIEDTAAW
jgi:dihydroflavonol-4-reductase